MHDPGTEAATDPLSGAEPRPFLLCNSCSSAGSCRVGIAGSLEWTPHRLRCGLVCPAGERGGETVAQGGWIAKVFDEVMAQLPIHLGRGGITRDLSVRFRRPVPIERELLMDAWLILEDGRYTTVGAELRLASTGAVLASAEATFVNVDAEHQRRHQEWLAGEDERAG